MLQALLGQLSPAGERSRLSILIFHRVTAHPDPLFPGEVDVAMFDRICGWLVQWFNVLALDDAAMRLRAGTLPARALAITFDDGYADNHDVALPILRRHRLPATVFVATGFLDGGRMWNDTVIEALRRCAGSAIDLDGLGAAGLGRLDLGDYAHRRAAIETVLGALKYRPQAERSALANEIAERSRAPMPGDLMMRSEQVLALHRAGVRIGAHTVTHPILAGLSADAARAEIERSRSTLASITGDAVTLFAYPNGVPGRDFDDATVALVAEAGFDAAVTTGWGAARRGTDRWRLPRFTPWDRSRTRFGLRLAANLRRT